MSITNVKSENANRIMLEIPEPKLVLTLSTKFINEGDRKSTSFKINARLHQLLKACAALENRQEGDLVNEAIADLLVKYNYLDITD